jgi:hypothetical protein
MVVAQVSFEKIACGIDLEVKATHFKANLTESIPLCSGKMYRNNTV